jgi:hypothetical protein
MVILWALNSTDKQSIVLTERYVWISMGYCETKDGLTVEKNSDDVEIIDIQWREQEVSRHDEICLM